MERSATSAEGVPKSTIFLEERSLAESVVVKGCLNVPALGFVEGVDARSSAHCGGGGGGAIVDMCWSRRMGLLKVDVVLKIDCQDQ